MSKILLHVGFPKAGSSFLGHWFLKNPNFLYKDFAICGINNTPELMDLAINTEGVNDKIHVLRDMRFSAPNSSDCRQIDNIESAQRRVALMLHSLFPGSKILIITRGFVSSTRANYSQYIKEGGILKFDEYFEKHKESKWLPFNYNFLIELYSKLFGQENMLILPFELLKKDPSEFINQIETFLNIKHFPYEPEIQNQSLTGSKMALIRKINVFVFNCLFLTGPLQEKIYKRYVKMLDRQKTKSWNNLLIDYFSKGVKPEKTEIVITDDIKNKFSTFGKGLLDYPRYCELKQDYFL